MQGVACIGRAANVVQRERLKGGLQCSSYHIFVLGWGWGSLEMQRVTCMLSVPFLQGHYYSDPLGAILMSTEPHSISPVLLALHVPGDAVTSLRNVDPSRWCFTGRPPMMSLKLATRNVPLTFFSALAVTSAASTPKLFELNTTCTAHHSSLQPPGHYCIDLRCILLEQWPKERLCTFLREKVTTAPTQIEHRLHTVTLTIITRHD